MSSIYLILRNEIIFSVDKDCWDKLFSEISDISKQYDVHHKVFEETTACGLQVDFCASYIEMTMKFSGESVDDTGYFKIQNPEEYRKVKFQVWNTDPLTFPIYLCRNKLTGEVVPYDVPKSVKQAVITSTTDIMHICRTKEELATYILSR